MMMIQRIDTFDPFRRGCRLYGVRTGNPNVTERIRIGEERPAQRYEAAAVLTRKATRARDARIAHFQDVARPSASAPGTPVAARRAGARQGVVRRQEKAGAVLVGRRRGRFVEVRRSNLLRIVTVVAATPERVSASVASTRTE